MILLGDQVVKMRDGSETTLSELGGGGILTPDTEVDVEGEDPTTLEEYVESKISAVVLTPDTEVDVEGEDSTTLEEYVESKIPVVTGWTLLKTVDITSAGDHILLEIDPNDHTTYVDTDFLIVIYPVIIGYTAGVDFSSDDLYVECKTFEFNSMHQAFESCEVKSTELFSHTNKNSNTVDTIDTYFGRGAEHIPARMLRGQFPARGQFTIKYKFIVKIYIK